MPMPKDDVNRIIKATIPINHLSSKFIMTSLVKIYFGLLSAALLTYGWQSIVSVIPGWRRNDRTSCKKHS